jgi:cytochrome c oxidase assembly factor CtaG
MLSEAAAVLPVLGHAGRPVAPHDLWGAWNASPVVVLGLLGAAWLYWRGGRRGVAAWRSRSFAVALVAVGVALVSPLDALSGALASAHMVQHLLLVLVAAPLLALSAPSGALLRGSPLAVRRAVGTWRRRLQPVGAWAASALRNPVVVWLLHAGTLWFWHAAVPYGWARHVPRDGRAVLACRVGRARRRRVPAGLGVLLVFTMGLQSIVLSLLLTFARSPWYAGYASSTAPWGLDALADQQLAGAIMWVPGGMVYTAAALALLISWLRSAETEPPLPEGRGSPAPPSVRAMPGRTS